MITFKQGDRSQYMISLAIGVMMSWAFLAFIVPISYPFIDPDTSYYIEAARNLLAGHGLVVSTAAESLPRATEHLNLWPPGFPLLIAAVSALFHSDPAWVAPKIVWLSWALLRRCCCSRCGRCCATGPFTSSASSRNWLPAPSRTLGCR
jgi:hypothetical protein